MANFIKVTALDKLNRPSEILLNLDDVSTIMPDMSNPLAIPQQSVVVLRTTGAGMVVQNSFKALCTEILKVGSYGAN